MQASKNFRFESVYFLKIRSLLKLIFKKKKNVNKFKKIKVWVFLKANHPISKKSKNSRMGKGKGGFLRWVTKLNRGFIFLELKNVNYQRVVCLNNQIQLSVGVKTIVINKINNLSV